MAIDKVDFLVKGVPNSILTMFKGLCSITGRTDSEGMIDLIIEYIDKNYGGDKVVFKQLVEEYRAATKKK